MRISLVIFFLMGIIPENSALIARFFGNKKKAIKTDAVVEYSSRFEKCAMTRYSKSGDGSIDLSAYKKFPGNLSTNPESIWRAGSSVFPVFQVDTNYFAPLETETFVETWGRCKKIIVRVDKFYIEIFFHQIGFNFSECADRTHGVIRSSPKKHPRYSTIQTDIRNSGNKLFALIAAWIDYAKFNPICGVFLPGTRLGGVDYDPAIVVYAQLE